MATIQEIERSLNSLAASDAVSVDGAALRGVIGLALTDLHAAYSYANASAGSSLRDLDAARLPLEAWYREISDGPYPIAAFRANRQKISRAYVEVFTAAGRSAPASLGDELAASLEALPRTLQGVAAGVGAAVGAIPLGLFEGLLPLLVVAAVVLVIVVQGGDKLGIDSRGAINRGLKL